MLFGSEQNPKGPGWRRLRKVEKDLSGTRVHFLAPPMRLPVHGRRGLEEQADSFDLDSPDIYIPYAPWDPDNPEKDIPGDPKTYSATIWFSGWNFTGRPILDRDSIGDLVLKLTVLEARNLPINASLFQRGDLKDLAQSFFINEQDLGSYHRGHSEGNDPHDLTDFLGLNREQWPDYLGPINSQWLERNGSEWLYFEVQPLWDGSDEFYWMSPIGHQRCLLALFMVKRRIHNAGNPYRRAMRSPLTNYRQLMENIMETITVELSEAAREEQRTVHNPEGEYPLLHCTEQLVKEAKHTLYMWSDKGYREKGKDPRGDHRAPKEAVAAFIDERIQPRPLPGNLAIGPAYLKNSEINTAPDSSGQGPLSIEGQ
ncbi:hypothetical protein OQJ59_01705 [Microbulbifer thermotolerans]|uniref:hypothetical protein n=1 Tax=Microbulbifer thermotolerans TaxID=252514 RepID=UPI002248BDC9|nr:hypothetical protein [Microbulbifer thermotolerans]MCX2795653.1 hypothetical protein [Microbulbifer thermotolerans]MCX2840329.1 hypothetical protein [Microbulbifer thermotolerans]